MCPERSPQKQQGAGLPIALFIITVLALLVVGMAQLQERSGQAVSLQIQSQRAFYAAESGAQVAVLKALDASCSAATDAGPVIFDKEGLSSCKAILTCDSVTADIGGSGGDTVYTITSTGVCGVGVDEAKRSIEVRAR